MAREQHLQGKDFENYATSNSRQACAQEGGNSDVTITKFFSLHNALLLENLTENWLSGKTEKCSLLSEPSQSRTTYRVGNVD